MVREGVRKDLEYYLQLPYTIELIQAPEGGWFVQVRELPGCMSVGETPNEAVEMIRDAMRLWIQTSLEDGAPIPEPRPLEDYSGRFVVRIPRSLHRDLVLAAEQEGVSLNQYVNVALARSVGYPATAQPSERSVDWPGLKEAIRQALLKAGLVQEAGELDEQLFAGRLDQLWRQAEEALRNGYFLEAVRAVETILQVLRPVAGYSPILSFLVRVLIALSAQVMMLAQEGMIMETLIRAHVSGNVQESLAQIVTREFNIAYSRASTPESLESLFGGSVRVRW